MQPRPISLRGLFPSHLFRISRRPLSVILAALGLLLARGSAFGDCTVSFTSSPSDITVMSGDPSIIAVNNFVTVSFAYPAGTTYTQTLEESRDGTNWFELYLVPGGGGESHDVSFTGSLNIPLRGPFYASLDNNALLRLRIDLSCGASATSDPATLHVPPLGTVTVSGGATICAGDSATVSVAFTGRPLPSSISPWSITWSDGVVQSGITSSPVTRTVSPTTTTTYSLTAITVQDRLYLHDTVTGSATVVVNMPPGITGPPVALSTDPGACVGTVSAFSPVLTGSPTPTVQYTVGGQPIQLPYAFPAGPTSVTATASNGCGPDATTTFTVTVTDGEKPVFTHCSLSGIPAVATCTASGIGANVGFSPVSATDNSGTPTVTYDPQPGFFPPGNTTVTATATDAAGNMATCPFTLVSVAYQWSGVLQPINADGSSVFKAGSTVPVKFQLTGPSACITTLQARLSYSLFNPNEVEPVNEADSPGAADTGNLFRYTGGQYQFNWSTKGIAPGVYLLHIDMGDGVSRTIKVGLR